MNFYDALKPKAQKGIAEQMHFNNLLTAAVSRFKYEGLPDSMPAEFVEGIFLTNGTAGTGYDKNTDTLYTVPGGYYGTYKGYLPERYKGVITDVVVDGMAGVDVAVGWNNSTLMPDLILMQYASILAEIDVSEKCNVLYSRFLRIPKVKDEREKQAITAAIKSISDGKVDALISSNIHDARDLITGNDAENFLDLVDVREIDKLQYLNQYRDNIIKRFFQIFGQKSQVSSKMAQMTDDEIHSNDSISMVLSYDALHHRQKWAEEVNRIFNTSITVDFAECWKDEISEMQAGEDVQPVEDEGGAEDGNSSSDIQGE